jgi:hypothetical protein
MRASAAVLRSVKRVRFGFLKGGSYETRPGHEQYKDIRSPKMDVISLFVFYNVGQDCQVKLILNKK